MSGLSEQQLAEHSSTVPDQEALRKQLAKALNQREDAWAVNQVLGLVEAVVVAATRESDADNLAAYRLLAEGFNERGREIDRLSEERHSTNEALSKAAEAIRAKDARVAELEAQAALVAEFVAARAEYITAIRNCHPDNVNDYQRWQGHAESRRQLAETLGLPVAWPAKAGAS